MRTIPNLPSTLSSSTFMKVTHNDDGVVQAELTPAEITMLYRRLSIHTKLHDYEQTSSTLLLRVMADCMKYARQKKIEVGEVTSNIWTLHIAFYDTLFPIFDALADLEEMINREDKSIDDLSTVLKTYETKIDAIRKALRNEVANKASVVEYCRHYLNRIDESFSRILTGVNEFFLTIKDNHNSKHAQALLSDYMVTNGIEPLGLFVVRQVKQFTRLLADYRRMYEYFSGHEDYIEKSSDCQKIDVLYDNKLAFKESFAGIRFSTARAIPEETIQLLRVVGGNTAALTDEKYTVTLNQFITSAQKTDLNAWEKLLCVISDERPRTVSYASAWQGTYFVSAIIASTIVEVAGTVAIRFPANIVVGCSAGLLNMCLDLGHLVRIVNAQDLQNRKNRVQDSVDAADKLMHETQNTISSSFGLSGFRKQRDECQRECYEAQFELLEKVSERKALIDLLTAIPKSSLANIAAENASAAFVADRFGEMYNSIAYFFYMAVIGSPLYLGGKLYRAVLKPQSAEQVQQDLFAALIGDLRAHLQQQHSGIDSAQAIENLLQIAGCTISEETTNFLQSLVGGMGDQGAAPAIVEFPLIRANKVGPSKSIMDFVEILCLEFSALMNGIFIKLPLASTLALIFSLTAFAATYFNMSKFLSGIINALSLTFTGERAVSDLRIMLASFLLWKLTTLGIEFVFAVYKRDPHFLEKLYGDPERIFLGLTTFVGLGLAIQLLPLIPTPINLFSNNIINLIFSMYPQGVKDFINAALSAYPALANIFIIEARVAWNGQIPFNLLEYFFIGLKAVFLFGALVSGRHNPQLHANNAEVLKIITALNTLAEPNVNRFLAAGHIIQLYNALGAPIERSRAQQLYDLRCKGGADSKSLEDLYNQSIYRGSNNMLQILFLLPGFFITFVFRAVMYVAALLLNSPVIRHGIQKDFCAEATMFIQVLAALIENSRSFVLSMNHLYQSLRAILFVSVSQRCVSSDFQTFNHDTLLNIEGHNHLVNVLLPVSTVYEYSAKLADYMVSCGDSSAWKRSPPSSCVTIHGALSHFANDNTAHEKNKKSPTHREAPSPV